MPTVSVIVPNYNHAPYLEQRVNSILNQTYQDFELIIMDDCSSDESRSVIDQYANHPKVSHIVYNEKNSGSTFKQWEKGIALAKGEWIWIAESDDWAEPNFLEELISQTNGSPNTNLAFTQLYLVQEEPKYISARFEGKNLHNTIGGLNFVQNHMLPHLSIWNASQAIFKKAAFYKVSSEYLKYKLCGDWIFWSEISLLGDVFVSGKFLSYFRKHAADVTTKTTASGLRFKEELQAITYLNELLQGFVHKGGIFAYHFSNFYSVRHKVPKQAYQEIYTMYSEKVPLKERIIRQCRAIAGELWKR
ncbi:glycosyltransferase family 2 protein [Sphingobacterium corticibacter]|uniref:Glycosyltransferase family 2 protein n=1 Tax=Sphingobacterium corticibacter TaxID=2171749 RepID=A0A2T8HK62_9SPHI|nr:glycosyltransferase [Sphingobacterium corticibacter]PVH25834.1 glycosyltransferase family 2 protein [Sphingobacterium corticibacter]